jgi:hypothetical protein
MPAPAGPLPAPPPAPAAPGEKPAEKPAGPRESVEVIVAPAYGNLDVDDDRADFYHYHRPPSGLFLNLLQVNRRDPAGFLLQQFWWRNLAESDQKGYLDLHLRRIPSFLRFRRDTTDFYGDPLLPGGPFSDRDNTRVRLRLERLHPSPALDLFFWDQRVSIPAIARLAPFTGVDYHAPEVGLRSTLPLAGGQLHLEPRHLEFDDRTGFRDDTHTTWLTGEYVRPLGGRADVSAAYDRISTAVSGRDTALWNVFRLQGNVRPTGRLFVDAFYRQQGINLPFTQTTYANRRGIVGVNASAYPARHTSLRAGVFHEDVRRQQGATGQTDHTAWTGGLLGFRAWNPGRWNFNARFRTRDLDNAPNARISALPSRETLYYTRERAVDARLDGFLGDRLDAYLIYGWRERVNGERDTRLTLNSGTLGATAQATPRLSVTAEYTQQLWDGNTRPFLNAAGGAPGGLPPKLFFSDGRSFSASLAYQLDDRSALDLTYNQFNSTGGQSARDHLAILQYRRDVNRSFFYAIGYQYERFKDNRLERDYTAFPLVLQVGLRRQFH